MQIVESHSLFLISISTEYKFKLITQFVIDVLISLAILASRDFLSVKNIVYNHVMSRFPLPQRAFA